MADPTILVVDDERKALARAMRALAEAFPGTRIISEPDAHQALARMCEEKVDVVVSDHQMPGMTGAELLAHARHIAPDAQGVLVAGVADEAAARRALTAANVECALAPPSPADLAATVAKLLKASQANGEAER